MKKAPLWLAAGALLAGAAYASVDGGTGARAPARHDGGALSAQDRELVENMDLLQNLDAAKDLDLLLELSKP